MSLLQNLNIRTLLKYIKDFPIFPGGILLIFIFLGIFGPYIVPYDPNEAFFADTLTPPFWQNGGTIKYLLGTDQLGRDVLSRIVCGTSISLQVGFVVVVFAGFIGSTIALISGYLGGWKDMLLMRITDIMMSIPYLMIAVVLAAVLGPSKKSIILILTATGWTHYARVLRGEVLRIKKEGFISLAMVAGCSKTRIMLWHIFPNMVNTLVVLATLQLGTVIIFEAILSFLGVGVPPPNPSWGLMVSEGRAYISLAWWLCTLPGLAILLVVLSCNLFGDWLRVRLDPKFRQI